MTGMVVGDLETGFKAIESGSVDCLQIFYNLLFQEAEPLLAAAREKGVGTIVRSPINSGLLSGSYKPDQKFPDNDDRSLFFHGPGFVDRLKRLKNIQNDLNVPDAELLNFALRFIISNPNVSTVIPGVSRLAQAENLIALGTSQYRFSMEKLQEIRDVVGANMAGYQENPQL